MAVVHTDGLPPNQGRICLLLSGWTWNNRKALSSTLSASGRPSSQKRWRGGGSEAFGAVAMSGVRAVSAVLDMASVHAQAGALLPRQFAQPGPGVDAAVMAVA